MVNNNVCNRKINIKTNIKFLIAIFVFSLMVVGSTYAYYAYQVDDTVAITGNVVAIDADLEVDLVVGTNEEMVPMTDEALSNALKGVGSTNGACVDAVGNLSCQVYKITLINKGSRLKHLNGTIKLYPQEGDDNAYTNLKWRELSNATTIKSDSVINGMDESFLVEDLTIESKTSMTWYIAVWISEADYDQRDTDKGLFGGTVKFDAGPGSSGSSGNGSSVSSPFVRNVMSVNAVSDMDIDFSKTSAESGTDGIYYIDSKARSTPIYYYRGNVNNNLIFADICWKIVRTTDTGGLKLIYNGLPSGGSSNRSCTRTGTDTQIATKVFNSNYNSPAYVGYMYGTPYTYSAREMYNDIINFANNVTYSDGVYNLIDTIEIESWTSDIYDGGLNNNHYTCFNGKTRCDTVYYIYYTDSSTAYYITLTNGKTVEDALKEMLDYNTVSSTIKGNKTTEGTIDYWYYTNIEQTGYKDYIEDTVWCNDRSVSSLNGWKADGGSTSGYLSFAGYNRAYITYEPSLICSRKIDSFTVDNSNGNGSLDYPVGLLTMDEIMLAGGKSGTLNSSYYLYNGGDYWSGSPYAFDDDSAGGFFVDSTSKLYHGSIGSSVGVRPSISLDSKFVIIKGDGTTGSPYVVGKNRTSVGGVRTNTTTYYKKVGQINPDTGKTVYTGWHEIDGILAYDVDRNASTPSKGSTLSDWIPVADDNLRKVLYYGYGGPQDRGYTYVETGLAASEAYGTGDNSLGERVYAEIVVLETPPDDFRVWRVETNGGTTADLVFYTYD